MVILMTLITRSGIMNADMGRAIGSFFTRSRSSSLLVGGIIHYTAGVVFAVLYLLLFQTVGAQGVWAIAAGVLTGFAHGYVMSFILVSSVGQHHPLKEFQEVGIPVAVAHFGGHIVYGAIIGLTVAWSGFYVPSSGEYITTHISNQSISDKTLVAYSSYQDN